MPDGPGRSRERQKHGLECVFGIVFTPQTTLTDGKHHRPMSANESCKGVFIRASNKAIEQFRIGIGQRRLMQTGHETQ